jgi:diguanylate cyclase (GGDEF)-like protein
MAHAVPELEHARTRQRAALWISVVGIAASLVSLLVDEPFVAAANAAVIAILLVNLVILRRGHVTTASIVGLATATGFVLWVAPDAGIRAYFWLHALPPVAYFMLGERLGTAVVLAMASLLTGQLLLVPPAGGSLLFTLDIALSFVTIGIISCIAERIRLHYQAALEQASLTDALTGLGNRRAAEQALEREAALARRGAATPSLVLFDVDGFKGINDRHGHDAGDSVLHELALILRETSRTTDHTARWGGEELICILPATDLDNARVFADRICRRVREHDFRGAGRVTISAGVAELAAESLATPDPIRDWLTRADSALYRAKEQGRDRVVLAPRGALSPAAVS